MVGVEMVVSWDFMGKVVRRIVVYFVLVMVFVWCKMVIVYMGVLKVCMVISVIGGVL